MPLPRISQSSDRSLRVELAPSRRRSPDETRAGIRALADAFGAGAQDWVVDVVPSAGVLLVVYDPGISPEQARANAAAVVREGGLSRVTRGASHSIAVCYHPSLAPDLEPLAAELGIGIDRLIELHSSASYSVDCLGFQPGFAYLVGLPEELHVPRLSTPRPRVARGSVGIGGDRTGVYPHATPGGWRLIGRTGVTLFDPASTPPALLAAGDTVRFVPVTLEAFRAMGGDA